MPIFTGLINKYEMFMDSVAADIHYILNIAYDPPDEVGVYSHN